TDVLPIHEVTFHDFIAMNDGIMHACGHAAHTAIILGTANLLHEQFVNGELEGTVKFIFQPAEEATDDYGLSGEPYMIKEGVLDDVDQVIALHACPWQPAGVIHMNHGFIMANVDVFQTTIRGLGGHGGYPHIAKAPRWMLGNILPAYYGITEGR